MQKKISLIKKIKNKTNQWLLWKMLDWLTKAVRDEQETVNWQDPLLTENKYIKETRPLSFEYFCDE